MFTKVKTRVFVFQYKLLSKHCLHSIRVKSIWKQIVDSDLDPNCLQTTIIISASIQLLKARAFNIIT